jgi:CelD/BcsL family acetyltransferase involved in cellulose biosynthesis
VTRLRFEVVRDLRGLNELAPAWQELTQRMGTIRHFHMPEWFLALVQALNKYDDHSYLFFAIFDSSELVGMIPLRTVDINSYGIPLKALRLLSNIRETLTTRDIILGDSIDRHDVLTEFIRYLDDVDSSWDVVAFAGALEDSCAMAAAQNAATLPTLSTRGGVSGRAEFISCGPGDDPLKRLSKSFRQNLRTAHNKLATEEVHFVCAQKPAELLAFYKKLASVEASGWKRKNPNIIRNNPKFDAFLRNLMSYLGPSGGCEIHLMEVSGRTISAVLCVTVNDICFIHVIGYDETYHRASPGNLLMEQLIKTRGAGGNITSITTYHTPPWFSSWKPDKTLKVSNIYIFRPTERGRDLHKRLSRLAAAKRP